jgi:hypothetical protein
LLFFDGYKGGQMDTAHRDMPGYGGCSLLLRGGEVAWAELCFGEYFYSDGEFLA